MKINYDKILEHVYFIIFAAISIGATGWLTAYCRSTPDTILPEIIISVLIGVSILTLVITYWKISLIILAIIAFIASVSALPPLTLIIVLLVAILVSINKSNSKNSE